MVVFLFFFSSRRRHTRFDCDWSSDVCSSDLCWVALLYGVFWISSSTALICSSMGMRCETERVGPLKTFQRPRFAGYHTVRMPSGSRPLTAYRTNRQERAVYGRSEERRVGKEGR